MSRTRAMYVLPVGIPIIIEWGSLKGCASGDLIDETYKDVQV